MARDFSTIVTLYQGVPLDNTYTNVVYFANPGRYTMDQFLNTTNQDGSRTFPSIQRQALSFQRKESVLRIGIPWHEIDTYNYLRFINPYSFGTGSDSATPNGQIYYAFVTGTEYVNENTTDVHFEIDVFSTYFTTGQVKIRGCMVERETVYNDHPGLHIEPEPLSPGDHVPVAYGELDKDLKKCCIVLCQNITPKDTDVKGTLVEGMYSGATYKAFPASEAGIKFADIFLADALKNGKAENVIPYMVPQITVESIIRGELTDEGADLPSTNEVLLRPIQPTDDLIPDNLDGYTPKNKKLLCYPYRYFEVDNSNGAKLVIPFEQCTAEGFTTLGVPYFFLWSTITVPVTTTLRWENKKAGGEGTNTLALTGYPTCSWTGDSYSRWYAQAAGPTAASIVNTGISGATIGGGMAAASAGASTTALSAISAINPVVGVATAAAVMGGARLLERGVQLQGEKYSAAHSPDYVCGNFTNGNALVGAHEQTFHAGTSTITYQQAKQFDDFFTRFGYAVEVVKTPTLLNRRFFDYIKTNGALVTGKAPTEAIAIIQRIFDSGVTLWHCDDIDGQIGNYDLDNQPIGGYEWSAPGTSESGSGGASSPTGGGSEYSGGGGGGVR